MWFEMIFYKMKQPIETFYDLRGCYFKNKNKPLLGIHTGRRQARHEFRHPIHPSNQNSIIFNILRVTGVVFYYFLIYPMAGWRCSGITGTDMEMSDLELIYNGSHLICINVQPQTYEWRQGSPNRAPLQALQRSFKGSLKKNKIWWQIMKKNDP